MHHINWHLIVGWAGAVSFAAGFLNVDAVRFNWLAGGLLCWYLLATGKI